MSLSLLENFSLTKRFQGLHLKPRVNDCINVRCANVNPADAADCVRGCNAGGRVLDTYFSVLKASCDRRPNSSCEEIRDLQNSYGCWQGGGSNCDCGNNQVCWDICREINSCANAINAMHDICLAHESAIN